MVFQFYLAGQAHTLLQSRLHGNKMAVDAEQCQLLETYPKVDNFLLCTYATDEFISEAVVDVTAFRQSSEMAEEVPVQNQRARFSNQRLPGPPQCGSVWTSRTDRSNALS